MLESLRFVFSSFWIWLGMVILLGVFFDGIVMAVRAFKKRPTKRPTKVKKNNVV